ncbi:hypothetical protein P3T76_000481 [Phytophthora citrophthora]|uniref:Uncharacterized protein n=1 Tax=Phytophthora citrophthora TaxID=4793 RepID=A0AAD9H0Z1_9STRA|nr:hypothetical protein P3T76_000481 [Phytophthora citrophthora]
MLAGAFRRDANPDGSEAPRVWQCCICSTQNEVVAEDPPLSCKTCGRSRDPPWLLLEDAGLQVRLGSRLLHTSVGGSKSVSVVVAINYAQRVVTLLRVKSKHIERMEEDIAFHEVVLNASQLQQQSEPLDVEQEKDCVLDEYGICGDCRSVFRVAQGDPHSQYANEDKVAELEKEIQQLNGQKQRLTREKAYGQVLEWTKMTKLKAKELQVAKRELEFLRPIFCPFCGWESTCADQ